mmetsp:Transcript_12912/g.24963  ORF Transcript_12912/g.24963 Transcript_12912/m.24963 type:complete len:114 (+) Transcript_12912:55-396(+)
MMAQTYYDSSCSGQSAPANLYVLPIPSSQFDEKPLLLWGQVLLVWVYSCTQQQLAALLDAAVDLRGKRGVAAVDTPIYVAAVRGGLGLDLSAAAGLRPRRKDDFVDGGSQARF